MNQTKPINNYQTELKTKIAAARRNLSSLWDAKGHIDREVLKASTELDLLVTEYTRLALKQHNNNEPNQTYFPSPNPQKIPALRERGAAIGSKRLNTLA